MINQSSTFKEFVLGQLSGIDGLRIKAMFGGFGLYKDHKIFGIIYNDKLYLKVNEDNRRDFGERDMDAFTTPRGQTLKNYFEVPEEVVENKDDILIWAWKALS